MQVDNWFTPFVTLKDVQTIQTFSKSSRKLWWSSIRMKIKLLPPASEGWGKVIVSVCPHLREGGFPVPRLGGGIPHPKSRWRGTPSQVWVWGYPIPGLGGGNLVPGFGGGTSSQVWVGMYPIPGLGGGYPIPGWGGTPFQVWVGDIPIPGLGRGTPSQVWQGTPSQVWVGRYPIPGPDRVDGVPLPHTHTSAKRALATRRALCLLRSRKRTFFLVLLSSSYLFLRQTTFGA